MTPRLQHGDRGVSAIGSDDLGNMCLNMNGKCDRQSHGVEDADPVRVSLATLHDLELGMRN